MDVFVHDEFPADAAYGADFLSRASKGTITETGPDGKVVRDEKVLVTSVDVDFEGRVCFGEKTVRHLAHQFGLVDGWRVEALKAEFAQVRDECEQLSRDLAKAREDLEFLHSLEREPAPTRLVALDGSTHTSLRGACEATAKLLGVEPSVVLNAVPVTVPQEVSS